MDPRAVPSSLKLLTITRLICSSRPTERRIREQYVGPRHGWPKSTERHRRLQAAGPAMLPASEATRRQLNIRGTRRPKNMLLISRPRKARADEDLRGPLALHQNACALYLYGGKTLQPNAPFSAHRLLSSEGCTLETTPRSMLAFDRPRPLDAAIKITEAQSASAEIASITQGAVTGIKPDRTDRGWLAANGCVVRICKPCKKR
jgi:hypothetical protein